MCGQLPMGGVHALYLSSVVRELTVEELLLIFVLSEVIVQLRTGQNRHTVYDGMHVQMKQTYCPFYANVTLHLEFKYNN